MPIEDRQVITQEIMETFRANLPKLNDVIAIKQGATLQELHPEMSEEELCDYGLELLQFARSHA